MQKHIKALIELRIDELVKAGRVLRPEWIAKEVLGRFEHVLAAWKGEDHRGREFWRFCGYKTVRSMVRAAVAKRTSVGVDNEQPEFPEFPRVQAYYDVQRGKEWVGVPVLQLTEAERRAKVAELRTMGHSLLEHADQLERFFHARRFA